MCFPDFDGNSTFEFRRTIMTYRTVLLYNSMTTEVFMQQAQCPKMRLDPDRHRIQVTVSLAAINTFSLKLPVMGRHQIAAMEFQTAADFK